MDTIVIKKEEDHIDNYHLCTINRIRDKFEQ